MRGLQAPVGLKGGLDWTFTGLSVTLSGARSLQQAAGSGKEIYGAVWENDESKAKGRVTCPALETLPWPIAIKNTLAHDRSGAAWLQGIDSVTGGCRVGQPGALARLFRDFQNGYDGGAGAAAPHRDGSGLLRIRVGERMGYLARGSVPGLKIIILEFARGADPGRILIKSVRP